MGMRLQARDESLLWTIYETGDGVLPRRYIHSGFWPHSTEDAMRKRLHKLEQAGYIKWPTKEEYHSWGIPESIVQLDWRGIIWIATQYGVEVDEPQAINESRRRILKKKLLRHGISWRRHYTRNILHDLQVLDFRLAVADAVNRSPRFELETWITERRLRVRQDRVTYSVKGKNGVVKKQERGVIPDGVFILKDEYRQRRARFLLELDMATHSNRCFVDDKVLPYAAYITSPVYLENYGANSGCWLVVVAAGERRLENLLHQTEKAAGDDTELFLFTSLSRLQGKNVLTAPIWEQPGRSEPMPLVQMGENIIPMQGS